jgi:hypothetical protein
MTVPDWRGRLICSKCGSREIDMVVTGTKRRPELTRHPIEIISPDLHTLARPTQKNPSLAVS